MTYDHRLAEILKNNYNLFLDRAQNSTDWQYKVSCINQANDAAEQYKALTGIDIEGSDD